MTRSRSPGRRASAAAFIRDVKSLDTVLGCRGRSSGPGRGLINQYDFICEAGFIQDAAQSDLQDKSHSTHRHCHRQSWEVMNYCNIELYRITVLLLDEQGWSNMAPKVMQLVPYNLRNEPQLSI